MSKHTPYNAFFGTVSLRTHVSATQYGDIIKWVKQNGFYYAVKAETKENKDGTIDGKCHVHFMLVREHAIHSTDPNDRRYSPTRLDKLRDHFKRNVTSIEYVTNQYGIHMCPLTSDSVIPYMQKETTLVTQNLPDDITVLYQYLAEIKDDKPKNEDILAHVNKYKELKYPEPASLHSVGQYLNYRWFILNDLTVKKQKIHRNDLAETILHMINGEGFDFGPAPKKQKKSFPTQKHDQSHSSFLDAINEHLHN